MNVWRDTDSILTQEKYSNLFKIFYASETVGQRQTQKTQWIALKLQLAMYCLLSIFLKHMMLKVAAVVLKFAGKTSSRLRHAQKNVSFIRI